MLGAGRQLLALVLQLALVTGPPGAWAGELGPMPAKNPYEGDTARATLGKSLFNQYCAHCHAPNAISPDAAKDLRRLKIRYGEAMAGVFHHTVTNGRPDKGMPNWKDILDDQTLWTIFTFLQSVQAQP